MSKNILSQKFIFFQTLFGFILIVFYFFSFFKFGRNDDLVQQIIWLIITVWQKNDVLIDINHLDALSIFEIT